MDRRNKEVVNIVKNLQDECTITIELLNKLLAKSVSQADAFQHLEENNVRLRTGRFLAFTQFQNSIIQKLLEFDIALEELIDDADRSCNLSSVCTKATSLSKTQDAQTELLQDTKLNLIHNYLSSIEEDAPSKYKLRKEAEESANDASESMSSSEYFNCTTDELRTERELDKTLTPRYIPKPDSIKSTDDDVSDIKAICEDAKLLTIEELHNVKVNDLCTIGYIESPSVFYIQIIDENSAFFDGLSSLLNDLTMDCTFRSKIEAMEALGRYCCIQIEDYWYRTEVIDWLMEDENEVMIQLIDFGATCQYSYKHLRFLCRESYLLPKMAQLCHLEGINPPYSNKNNKHREWPQESIDAFFNICGDLEKTVFRIKSVSPMDERNSYGIRFAVNDGSLDDLDVGQILLDKKFAVDANAEIVTNGYIINQIQACHGLQGLNAETTTDDILEKYFESNKIIEAGNVNEAVMSYDPRDEALTCKNLRPDGTCYKGSACPFRHIPLQGGFTMDKVPIFHKAFKELQLPEVGDEIFLKICHIINIQRFYAQIRVKNDNTQYASTLSHLIKTMNNVDTAKGYKKLQHPPAIGQLVIVKHWNDNWCRGQVHAVQIPENDNNEVTVDVYIVDYGDVISVSMSNVREMLKEFLLLPFQAIECRINNVKPKRSVDESDEKRFLESLCLSDIFKAKVVAARTYLHVLLYTRDGEDVGETIVAAGFGEFNTEHDIRKDEGLYLID